MALRDVKAFDTEQMTLLKVNMERGASEKQIKNLKKAQEHVANATVKRNFKI